MRKFTSGAIRDSEHHKEDYIETISWTALKRYAQYMTSMSKKYGRGNWIKGIDIESYERSLMRHLQKYFSNKYNGTSVEPEIDHLSAAMFNLQGIMHEQNNEKKFKQSLKK